MCAVCGVLHTSQVGAVLWLTHLLQNVDPSTPAESEPVCGAVQGRKASGCLTGDLVCVVWWCACQGEGGTPWNSTVLVLGMLSLHSAE